METTQLFQQLAPATVTAALLALPWAVIAVLHVFGAMVRANQDDDWSDRAFAAVRWAGTAIEPPLRLESGVRKVAMVRRSSRSALDTVLLPHAA
jgi:hypothetical protein